MWLWIYFIVTTTVTVRAVFVMLADLWERRAQRAVEARKSRYDLRRHEGYARAMDGGEIDAVLKDLGMHEDDQVCGHIYSLDKKQVVTCDMGRWAHEPHLGLDHAFIPVDVDRCPGHPDLPLGHDTD